MEYVLGIDVGTNSIGLYIRTKSGKKIYFAVIVFPSGIGRGKNGEFSFAAEKTKYKSIRKLYRRRRYRKWAVLALLIEHKLCPLSKESLDNWRRYDKKNGANWKYPINDEEFLEWLKRDPYKDRNELATTKQLDFSDVENRYKLGRALYHIAQRRGFRSSKGETLDSQSIDELGKELETVESPKKSEQLKSKPLVNVMEELNLPTVGCALYELKRQRKRIRSEYQAVRSQYKDEITYIFQFQEGLSVDSKLYEALISEKKDKGTIFYKRPLQSQKGNVGKCILEPNKSRCPQSRPEFELYRAWQFINTIRYGQGCLQELSIEEKESLLNERFMLKRRSFKFSDIREWIEKRKGCQYQYDTKNKEERTINYSDAESVSGCPVINRFRALLGNDWESWRCAINKEHTNRQGTAKHPTVYTWEDIWHLCFSADHEDCEILSNIVASTNLDLLKLKDLWNSMCQGYASLSLKAVNNILRFLKKGLLYDKACLLAKLPDIFGEKWSLEIEESLIQKISQIADNCKREKTVINIVNALIANYKSLPGDEMFAFKDYEYLLAESDKIDVESFTKEYFGKTNWEAKSEQEKAEWLNKVEGYYQQFFSDESRNYIKMPKIEEKLKAYLRKRFIFLTEKSLDKIYHHSLISFYRPAKMQRIQVGDSLLSMKLLESPVITGLKTPMAMRVLHILRRQINNLLMKGIIVPEETRVVIEVARDLNDANMRWAIDQYQEQRAAENEQYRKAILRHYKKEPTEDDIKKVRLFNELCEIGATEKKATKADDEKNYKEYMKSMIKKYRLWMEQGARCIYTGKFISITSLFSENELDIEHTIPRSISFDDSLQNQTLCYAQYNRGIKRNQMPSQLPGYDEILNRIQPWFDKVRFLRTKVAYWKNRAKLAQDKEQKDYCIKQKHVWQMELDYWQGKVQRFEMKEVTPGFRNNQLIDTRIISKYAFHFLKSVFPKVEVQKGEVTAVFRKILGIQSFDAKKDREKHSHHAVDAMVLTYIPVAAQRDKILKLYYEFKEARLLGRDTDRLQRELESECEKCGLKPNFKEIVSEIENTILIQHYKKKNQESAVASRRWRKNGKIVPLRDEENNIVYEEGVVDKYGHKIPKAKRWLKGDSIRGELHKDTFYGAIKQGDSIVYVVRKSIEELKEKDVNKIVDKRLKEIIQKQIEEKGFDKAKEDGFYVEKKNKMHNENAGKEEKMKVRHVRCKCKLKNPLKVKKHIFLSEKSYKQMYYAEVGANSNFAMCKYQRGEDTEFKIYRLLDISKNAAKSIPHKIEDGKVLKQIFHQGDMVLLYKDKKEELYDLDTAALSRRLYIIKGFEDDGRMRLARHLYVLQEGDEGKSISGIDDFNQLPICIRASVRTLHFLLEDSDFKIVDGKIDFIKDE